MLFQTVLPPEENHVVHINKGQNRPVAQGAKGPSMKDFTILPARAFNTSSNFFLLACSLLAYSRFDFTHPGKVVPHALFLTPAVYNGGNVGHVNGSIKLSGLYALGVQVVGVRG